MDVLKTYRMVLLLVLLQVFMVKISQGCRPDEVKKAEGEGGSDEVSRQKRHLYYPRKPTPAPAPELLTLEVFFLRCMRFRDYINPINLQTIISYTIQQTSWFAKTDSLYCRAGYDTVECWRYLVDDYMRTRSEFSVPAKHCITSYGRYRNRPGRLTYGYHRGYRSFPLRSEIALNVDDKFFLGQVRAKVAAINQTLPDPRTLVRFFREDAICSKDFCDCTGVNLPPHEHCGDNWYTRFVGLTRVDSPIREALVNATNAAIAHAQEQHQPTLVRPHKISTYIANSFYRRLMERFLPGYYGHHAWAW